MDLIDVVTEGTVEWRALLLNLAFGAMLAWALQFVYVRFARVPSDRAAFAANFLPIILAVIIIISVVKASIALSLGLVGALSVVRFRTPIKDPEELAYLMLVIAVGIGLGASERFATSLAVLSILITLALRGVLRGDAKTLGGVFVELERPLNNTEEPGIAALSQRLTELVPGATLERYDVGPSQLVATFFLAAPSSGAVASLGEQLRKTHPDARITVVRDEGVVGGL